MMPKGSGVDICKKTHNLFTRAIPFIMARRKESGGFGATPRVPASVADTYQGLKTLELARQYGAIDNGDYDPRGDKDLHAYLSACLLTLTLGPRTRFQLLCCFRAAGIYLDRRAVADTLAAQLQGSVSVESWYYHAKLFGEVLEMPLPEAPEIRNDSSAIIGKWRTVDEAWMHVYLARYFRKKLPLPDTELITWFQKSQNGDGGFGFFPGTTSFVENCHASLRALVFLGSKPRNPTGVFQFLKGCQTISGGFGRSISAAPFLDATWHALSAFAILDGRYFKQDM